MGHVVTDTTDAVLTAQAAGGDQRAFRALYRAHVRPVYWIAYGLVRNAADAEDVTQETFVVAWQKLRGFELAGESLLPWLSTICRFQAANRIRRIRRDRERTTEADDQLPTTVDVEQQVIDRALAERIVDEIDTLSPLDRQIFVLCATEGWSYDAAAEHLGVGHGIVRNRLSRIRTRLRTALEENHA